MEKEVLSHNWQTFLFECCTESEPNVNTKVMLLFEKSKKKAENGKMNKRGFICQSALATFLQRRKFSSFLIGFHPLACIDKCFYPRSDLVAVHAVGGVATVLPGEDGTFQVGHHGQMTSVGTC